MTVHEKINSQPPHKLLALDGGGIRGIISIEVLARIEEVLRQELDAGDDFVLADYFDYIGGTSTGAIIATALAMGMSVKDIREFYHQSGKQMFRRAFSWLPGLGQLFRFAYFQYRSTPLRKKLESVFGKNTELGTDKLKTLLMVVLANQTTNSAWTISNNPYSRFNQPQADGCNLNFSLVDLVRASTAAPTYFRPETLRVGFRRFDFVDGGMTSCNNPALQLFLMATSPAYQPHLPPGKLWPVGEKELLLVSVGTGTPREFRFRRPLFFKHLKWTAPNAIQLMMNAAAEQQDTVCRMLGKCVHGPSIDQEVGDLKQNSLSSSLFTYLRYNVILSQTSLDQLRLNHIHVKRIQEMDSVSRIPELEEVGQVAAQQVDVSHFNGFL